jgi:hypothetical protein
MAYRLILAAVALLLIAPAPASASKRFSGCVAESHGCSHTFFGGDLPILQLKDRKHSFTHYKVCVRDPVHRVCANRTTGKKRHWHRGATWNIGAVGKHVARWYVNGEQVARWIFRVKVEPE